MSWVRLDDGFASHPKPGALTDREFRVWIRLLCWAASYNEDTGEVPAPAHREIPGFSPRLRRRFLELELLDAGTPDVVHDWAIYNGKTAEERDAARQAARERQRRKRERDASRDDPPDAADSARDSGSDNGVTAGVTDTVTSPRAQGARAGAHTRGPQPQGLKRESKQRSLSQRPRDELWDILTEELGEPATRNERNKRNGALKQLREIGASAGELQERLIAYRTRWPALDVTATAIVSNWTLLGRPAPQDRRRGLTAADLIHAAKEAE